MPRFLLSLGVVPGEAGAGSGPSSAGLGDPVGSNLPSLAPFAEDSCCSLCPSAALCVWRK